MRIELKEITVKELSKGYQDNAEDGVVGMVVNLTFVHHISESLFTKTNSVMPLSILSQRIFLLM